MQSVPQTHFVTEGKLNQTQVGLKTQKMCLHFHQHAAFGYSISIHNKTNIKTNLFASKLSFLGHSHFGSLFANEEQEKVYGVFLPHMLALFMMSLTQTAGPPIFKQNEKLSEKLLCGCCLVHSHQLGLWCFFGSDPL